MKLIDAIMQVERPESTNPWDFSPPLDEIREHLNMVSYCNYPDELLNRLKSYPILEWMCTDEHVGLHAIYLDGEAVGCHYRSGRKMDYEIEWISSEARQKTYNAIRSYDEEEQDEIHLINPDQDIGEDYNVGFTTQLLTDEGFYDGRPVRVLVKYDSMARTTPEEYRREGRSYVESVSRNDPRANCLLIQDGEAHRIIPIDQFRIPFKLQRANIQENA